MKQLTLGTAQWGLQYGITNTNGQVTYNEIKRIILSNEFASMLSLDTAQSYGDAEKLVGKISSYVPGIKVTTKLKKLDNSNLNFVNNLEQSIFQSLTSLCRNQFDCLLLHDFEDTKSSHFDELCQLVDDLKKDKIVLKFGVSIYSDQVLTDSLLQLFDVIQLPVSVFDQRIIQSGFIKHIKDSGCHIQCRSIFMQGVLASSFIDKQRFSPDFIDHHQKWFHYCDKDEILMKKNALQFVASIPEVDEIIFGVTSYDEFQEIARIWNTVETDCADSALFSEWGWYDAEDIDPRQW